MIKQALILAAGQGVRMGEAGREAPKGFIELGGETLIARQLRLLAERGIDDVTIVTGHLAHFFDGYGTRRIHNPQFAEKGSLWSLVLGLAAVRGPFLLLESDITFQPRALDAMLAGEDANILISGRTDSGDEVYVWDKDGQFAGMHKNPTAFPGTPRGELVGILRISEAQRQAVLAIEAERHAQSIKADYESGLVAAMALSEPIGLTMIEDLVWTEIDDQRMLDRARDLILPRL